MSMQDKPTTLSDEEFAALFPVTRNADLARQLGVSIPTIGRRARALGLAKDPAARYAHVRQPRSEETRAKMSAGQKGRTFSAETRAKMSAAQVGRVLPPEWRANISKGTKGKPKPPGFAEKATGRRLKDEVRKERKARMAERGTLPTGERHYAWKGGIVPKPFARYSDPRYAQWRDAVLERDQRTCQQCSRVFIRGQRGLHAHHLKPYAKHVEVRFAADNGVALCTRCHNGYHRLIAIEAYERMEQVPCACGCGGLIYPIGVDGRRRRYIRGHGARGRPSANRGWKNTYMTQEEFVAAYGTMSNTEIAQHCHVSQVAVGHWARKLGLPKPVRGWSNAYMTQDEFVAAYAVMPSSEIAARCHVSPASITHWARALGLPQRYRSGGTGLIKPRTALAAGQWGPGRERCALCGTTEVAHKGHNLCIQCYSRRRTLTRNPDAETRQSRMKSEPRARD